MTRLRKPDLIVKYALRHWWKIWPSIHLVKANNGRILEILVSRFGFQWMWTDGEIMTEEEQDELWLNTRDAAYADVVIMNDDHKCVNCDVSYPCERPTWDDCDCPIYCGACEEAQQETPA